MASIGTGRTIVAVITAIAVHAPVNGAAAFQYTVAWAANDNSHSGSQTLTSSVNTYAPNIKQDLISQLAAYLATVPLAYDNIIMLS